MKRILFVCTGNLCRSVLAEYLFRDIVEKAGRGDAYDISSAGTMGLEGNLSPTETLEAGREHGVDLEPHRARRLTKELVREADWIFGMELAHCRAALELDPRAQYKIRLLGHFAPMSGGEVPDPYGRPVKAHLHSAEVILRSLPGLFQELEKESAQEES
ncbi:MAG: low molecular weight protein-tyrosine-phosphatase [Planctomycetota bacterium]